MGRRLKGACLDTLELLWTEMGVGRKSDFCHVLPAIGQVQLIFEPLRAIVRKLA